MSSDEESISDNDSEPSEDSMNVLDMLEYLLSNQTRTTKQRIKKSIRSMYYNWLNKIEREKDVPGVK